MTLPETIAHLRALLAAATRGPWRTDGPHDTFGRGRCLAVTGGGDEPLTVATVAYNKGDDLNACRADADLIAAARNHLPEPLDALEDQSRTARRGETVNCAHPVLCEPHGHGTEDECACCQADIVPMLRDQLAEANARLEALRELAKRAMDEWDQNTADELELDEIARYREALASLAPDAPKEKP